MEALSVGLINAIRQAARLPADRQEALATRILVEIDEEQREPDPAVAQFHQLVMAKYTRGLTPSEAQELERLETQVHQSLEAFDRPILERARALKALKDGGSKAAGADRA